MARRGGHVRVVGGTAGGLLLKIPKRVALRPTQDRIKQVIFNTLADFVPGQRVLDLYAGTGALGIEALSRGAESCRFVELAGDAVEAIRENLRHCGMTGEVIKQDVMRYLAAKPPREPGFGLVLADPPYEKARGDLAEHPFLATVRPWVSEGGRLVWEHYSGMFWKGDVFHEGGWRLLRHRNYGETGLSILEAVAE